MGFWSTLGGIVGTAASFIPGVGPIAGGLIKAATGIGGMVGDAVTGGGPGGSGGGLLPVDASKNPNGTSDPAVQQGLNDLQGPKSYLNGVLNGSQEQTEGLLAPEVSTVLGQYDNAAKTAAELGPRGGGRTAILAEAPFKKVAAYGTALAGAKKTALDELPKIGEAESQIGTNQEQLNNQKQAEINAQNGLPSEQYNLAMRNIQRQQMNALSRSQDRRSAGALIPAIQDNSNMATLNLDAKNAEARLGNQRYLGSVNNQIAGTKGRIYGNYLANYLRQQDYARKLQYAAAKNKDDAIESGVGGLVSFGGMMGGGSGGSGGGNMQSLGGSVGGLAGGYGG